ncbi:cupin domain-containing protein [Ponticaulis sp.]|uniref:cupin domain-containing protein n=1 Tax=Ponticaulis sp. TaxID=2020902 RepID=UPI000B697362|nr:cupin domain-containing protein [Ponticaulis sp.]MAI90944.1 hypothetical protein [Ponticaulis sp.]OUX98287.1 MAG: hypothetical protein CBB65_10905 [Hyphomonadaceae bacterium TMED5]
MSEEQELGQELQSAYAAGTLDPALTLLLDTRAALRADIRQEQVLSDAVAGEFLEREIPAPMSFQAAERALERIDALAADAQSSRKAAKVASAMIDELIKLPEPLMDVALQNSVKSGWKFGGPGIRIMPLDVSPEVTAEIIRFEPGCGAPMHTHSGFEYTLVVSGGFSDEEGSYGPGDLAVSGVGNHHRPVADEDGVCIALIVRDGDLKFRGFLGVLQKVFG